jgi:hypothetical protein
VIAKLLQPGELLKLQNLVPELLGNLVVDKGLNPPSSYTWPACCKGVGTDNADFRALPTVPEGIYDSSGQYLSVVRMVQPDADELLRRLREASRSAPWGRSWPAPRPRPPTSWSRWSNATPGRRSRTTCSTS